MIATQLTNGQLFKLVHRGHKDVLECVDEKRPVDWMRYPGIVYRNTRTGLNGGLGGANEIVLYNAPAKLETREWRSMDIDSGLGIGEINNDQSMPSIPSARAIERVQKMHDTDMICKLCGASAKFDGAMFTTLGGSNICDDCV
jgi:hypothetical protein